MSDNDNLKHSCGCEHHEHDHEGDCCCHHDHEGDCCCHHDHEGDCCCHHDHEDDCCCHPHKQTPHIATPSFKPQDPDKGVSLGPEVENEIAQVMTKRYKRFLNKDEKFSVKTEVCHHFGLVRAELSNPGRTTSVCVEVSVECEPNQIENPLDAYNKALDVLDLVYLDYFDSDRISHYLPIWQSYEIDDQTVNVRLEHSNPALDDAASEFLKSHGFLESGLSPEDYEDV